MTSQGTIISFVESGWVPPKNPLVISYLAAFGDEGNGGFRGNWGQLSPFMIKIQSIPYADPNARCGPCFILNAEKHIN